MSVRVLALVSTTEFGSLAVVEDGLVIEEVPLHSPDGFSHILFDQIESLLKRRGIRLAGFDGFAAASGPGSFTGVRVGLTAVKGLAAATGRKAAAVSNLQALAWFGSHALRAAVLDARRGEVYGAIYDAALRPVREEVVMKFPDWVATVPEGDLEIITNGFPIAAGLVKAPITQAPRALAGAVGTIAIARFVKGLASDPAEIDANYVRRSDAELMWKDR